MASFLRLLGAPLLTRSVVTTAARTVVAAPASRSSTVFARSCQPSSPSSFAASTAQPVFAGRAFFATRSYYDGHSGDDGSGAIPPHFKATTVLAIRKAGKVVVIADGQVSLGHTVVKPNARKVRRIKDSIIVGFAGATADCLTLFERLELKLEEYPGQLLRSCVEMAKNWRTDKYLRRLEAVMVVADKEVSLMMTGNGDVIEPHENVIAIGSGGSYALAAARALMDTELDAEQVARKAMTIAADMCIYTNHNFVTEVLVCDQDKDWSSSSKDELAASSSSSSSSSTDVAAAAAGGAPSTSTNPSSS